MTAGGSQTPAGSGNGPPPRRNSVSVSQNYGEDRAALEEKYPQLRELEFFRRLEAYMVVCEVEEDARFLSGNTWIVTTPEDVEPLLTVFFTYYSGHITLQRGD